MDIEPPTLLLSIILLTFSSGVIWAIFYLLLLIVGSALISGSEVAFYSLGPKDFKVIKEEVSNSGNRILKLKEKPRTLLATILICNNFINIAIVIVSDYVVRQLIGPEQLKKIGTYLFDYISFGAFSVNQLANIFNFTVTVIGVTFILVLFGEIAPKIYANLNNLKFARFMSGPLTVLNKLFGPFSRILVKWSNNLEEKIMAGNNLSSATMKEDIDKAIELTVNADGSNTTGQEADILKSIVKFGDVSAKQIMKSRVDVIALDITLGFTEVLKTIKEHGFSRIPVYSEDFDNIKGILYVKDLIGYTAEDNDFDWQGLVREDVLYVPESKKIDDLLREFQLKRLHIAIIVDEYGGSAGLVTLEDIMEEVVGDIKDEFDEGEDVDYIKLGENNFIFDGKTLLNDVCRIIGVNTEYFDMIKGESDSLAGMVLEVAGVIPKIEHEIKYRNVVLKIISVTKRRIEKINLRIV